MTVTLSVDRSSFPSRRQSRWDIAFNDRFRRARTSIPRHDVAIFLVLIDWNTRMHVRSRLKSAIVHRARASSSLFLMESLWTTSGNARYVFMSHDRSVSRRGEKRVNPLGSTADLTLHRVVCFNFSRMISINNDKYFT